MLKKTEENFINTKKQISINRIVISICALIYVFYTIVETKTGDSQSTMILFGVDYKTFTLCFGEYFRLITSGFCHFSFIHLMFNLLSLLSLGNFIEIVYGSKRYIIYLLCGILIGSLTSGVLNTNVFECGISAGLYCFLVIFILYLLFYHQGLPGNFIYILIINIGMNFMSNIAWQAHLGGAIAGFILFFIDYYSRTNNKLYNLIFKILLVVTIVFLSFKYYSTKDSVYYYGGTDKAYVEYTKKYVPFLGKHYENKIYNLYMKKGQ